MTAGIIKILVRAIEYLAPIKSTHNPTMGIAIIPAIAKIMDWILPTVALILLGINL